MAYDLNLSHDQVDERTLRALDAIERRREIARALVPTGYEPYFQDQARFLSAHTTVSIEGNRLDYQSVQVALLEESTDPNRREAKNAAEAYEFAGDLAPDPSLKIDSGLIRTINSILLRDLPGRATRERGRYRLGGAMIQDSVTREINYLAPPSQWVAELMQSLESGISQWMQSDPPEIAAAKAHFGLISIHPFFDGNGRTARLIADLILNMTNRSADGMLSISGVLLKRREEYYEALRLSQGSEFTDRVDVTAFVRFHTESLATAVTELEERTKLLDARRFVLERDYRGILNSRRVIGLLYLNDVGPLSTSAYARFASCSQQTALSDLNELSDSGVVERTGRASATRYELTPTVRELLGGVE
jgi:Fic family protein